MNITYTFGLRGCYMPDDVCELEYDTADEMKRDIIATVLQHADFEDVSEDDAELLTAAAEDINLLSDAEVLQGVAVNYGQWRMEWSK
jgi:hypothetical protein